ncbi:uncharacterized protein RB166_002283 [Leptodactylus fuscus]
MSSMITEPNSQLVSKNDWEYRKIRKISQSPGAVRPNLFTYPSWLLLVATDAASSAEAVSTSWVGVNMKRQPRSRIHGGNVKLWNVTSDEEVANEFQEEPDVTSSLEDLPVRRHFFYVGTPKRIQELTEEERFFEKEEIKVPSAIQLDKILKAEKNIQTCGSAAQLRNSFLTQPSHYSRYQGKRGYPSVSSASTMRPVTDGASSKRWLPKPLTTKPKPCLSRDTEDVPPP